MSETKKADQEKPINLFWKCGKCGNTLQAPNPPEICPSCKEKCLFKDVSCYTPECGGPGHIDPRM